MKGQLATSAPTEKLLTYSTRRAVLSYLFAMVLPVVGIGLYVTDPSRFTNAGLGLVLVAGYYSAVFYALFFRLLKMPAEIAIGQRIVSFRFILGKHKVVEWNLADLDHVVVKEGFFLKPIRSALQFRNRATGEVILASTAVVGGAESLKNILRINGDRHLLD